MDIVIASIVRNAVGYLPRHFEQVEALHSLVCNRGYSLKFAITVGESADDTNQWLERYSGPVEGQTWQHENSGPVFGSVNDPVRWANIARTWNGMFNRIADWEYDALIYVEADLIWQPEIMLRLLDHLEYVPAVAPMSMIAGRENTFYDTWGHRAHGRHFTNEPPFHPALLECEPNELMQIDSAGSCKVMRSEVARKCRFNEADAMLGHSIYAEGYSLWLDPSVSVYHP